ncbi:MAG: hypothetical protein V2I97_13510 [Desulfococcaceae bacterium]|jgi:hypothetical protein|nr:hypothetical protein [Desulfococcaceae bacterium]
MTKMPEEQSEDRAGEKAGTGMRFPVPPGPGSAEYNQISYIFWWILNIVFTLMSLFFLAFGIEILIAAYHLRDPFSFIMCFFSSNFIILISLSLSIAFIWRMILCYRNLQTPRL